MDRLFFACEPLTAETNTEKEEHGVLNWMFHLKHTVKIQFTV